MAVVTRRETIGTAEAAEVQTLVQRIAREDDFRRLARFVNARRFTNRPHEPLREAILTSLAAALDAIRD